MCYWIMDELKNIKHLKPTMRERRQKDKYVITGKEICHIITKCLFWHLHNTVLWKIIFTIVVFWLVVF